MVIGKVDYDTVQKVLEALSSGMHRVEAVTAGGRKVVGYCVTDKQIRIDIKE